MFVGRQKAQKSPPFQKRSKSHESGYPHEQTTTVATRPDYRISSHNHVDCPSCRHAKSVAYDRGRLRYHNSWALSRVPLAWISNCSARVMHPPGKALYNVPLRRAVLDREPVHAIPALALIERGEHRCKAWAGRVWERLKRVYERKSALCHIMIELRGYRRTLISGGWASLVV